MNITLSIGVASLISLLLARCAKSVGLPSVTGYLIAGLILGSSMLNVITKESVEYLSFVCDIALGIIAFHLGRSFCILNIRKIGKRAAVISLFEVAITQILIFMSMFFLTKDFHFSILISTISTATAPAVTLMVIKEYGAKGELTDTICTVIAIDDFLCILIYSIISSIMKISLIDSTFPIEKLLLEAVFIEIIGSLILGCIAGILTNLALKDKHNNFVITFLPLAFIMILVGIAPIFKMSILLTALSFGATVSNGRNEGKEVFEKIDELTPFLLMLFFVFSGTEFDFNVVRKMLFVGIIYVVARIIGKIAGAYAGSIASNADEKIRKYVGLGLLPQAGVALGLARMASETFPTIGHEILNLVITAVLIYELVGPITTKTVLIKAKEIKKF